MNSNAKTAQQRARIILQPKRETSVRFGHPWIFSGAVKDVLGEVADGTLVDIFSSKSECLGTGHYYSRDISVRMLSRERIESESDYFAAAFDRAYSLRTSLRLVDNPETTAYRLINAEGDGLPGLVIDIYNNTAVAQFQLAGMERCSEFIVENLRRLFQEKLSGIFKKNVGRQVVPLEENSASGGQYLWGTAGNPVILENGLKFFVDWEHGQKTGFFLDQRDNRLLARKLAEGRKVLNAFCYTGGFSLYTLVGGAKRVDSIDSSKPSLEILNKNLSLNQEAFNSETEISNNLEDCFEFLNSSKENYDLVILDPPAFVKHRKSLNNGMRAYEKLNSLALSFLRPHGILMTFSCSQLVTPQMFLQTLQRSSFAARCDCKIIAELSQSMCHPHLLQHAEGQYLKGLAVAKI